MAEQGFSQQDIQDLQQIRAALPAGDARAAKIDALLKAQTSSTPKEKSVGDSIKDFVSEWWNQVNPVKTVTGMAESVNHPLQTLKNYGQSNEAVLNKAIDSWKAGNHAEGARHFLNYLVPVIGTQTDAAGDLLDKGEYAKGSGMTAGIATNVAAPTLVKGAAGAAKPVLNAAKTGAQSVARDMYQSALKPRVGSNVSGIVDAGLENQVPISASGVDKIYASLDNLNQQITNEIASQPGRTVNKYAVARRINDTAKQFSEQVNPGSDLKQIAASKNEFLATNPGQIPAADAQAMKVGTYRQLKGKYGEMKSASMEAQKSLARGLKEELDRAFPELQNLNAKEAALLNLQPALEKALTRIGNHQLIGIGTPIAGGAAGVMTGSAKLAAVTAAMKAVLDNPVVKSRLAIALNQAGRKIPGGISAAAANARIAGYSNLLSRSLQSPDSTAQPEQTEEQ